MAEPTLTESRAFHGPVGHHSIPMHLAERVLPGPRNTKPIHQIANGTQLRKRGDSKGHRIKPTGCDNYIVSINLKTIYILHPDK